MSPRLNALLILVLGSSGLADETERTLFVFVNPDAEEELRIFNSAGSTGRLKLSDNKMVEFFGTLKDEDAHASLRTNFRRDPEKGHDLKKLDLEKGDIILTRVRRDGRKYTIALYPDDRKRVLELSYRASFKTKKDEWLEVRLPLDKFKASAPFRIAGGSPDPEKIYSLGFISDNKAGPFNLEIEWVKVRRPRPDQ